MLCGACFPLKLILGLTQWYFSLPSEPRLRSFPTNFQGSWHCLQRFHSARTSWILIFLLFSLFLITIYRRSRRSERMYLLPSMYDDLWEMLKREKWKIRIRNMISGHSALLFDLRKHRFGGKKKIVSSWSFGIYQQCWSRLASLTASSITKESLLKHVAGKRSVLAFSRNTYIELRSCVRHKAPRPYSQSWNIPLRRKAMYTNSGYVYTCNDSRIWDAHLSRLLSHIKSFHQPGVH